MSSTTLFAFLFAFLFACGLLGCGGSSPVEPPKTAPVVSAGPGAALPAMEAETDAERAEAEQSSSANKVSECNAMIDVINETVKKLDVAATNTSSSATGLEGYQAMVNVMDEARLKLAKLSLQDARLRGYSKEYQKMAMDVVKSSRVLISAAETNDLAGVRKGKEAVEAAVKAEDPLIDGINQYCHAP